MLGQTTPPYPSHPSHAHKIPKANTVCRVHYEQWGQMLKWKYTCIFKRPKTNPTTNQHFTLSHPLRLLFSAFKHVIKIFILAQTLTTVSNQKEHMFLCNHLISRNFTNIARENQQKLEAVYCFHIHVSLPFSSAPQGVEVWQRSVCCSSPPYCLPMLLLGGSPGCCNLSRLYFTLIVLSLSTENVSFLLPSVGLIVVSPPPLWELQLFALQWMIKENSVLEKQLETTSDTVSTCR